MWLHHVTKVFSPNLWWWGCCRIIKAFVLHIWGHALKHTWSIAYSSIYFILFHCETTAVLWTCFIWSIHRVGGEHTVSFISVGAAGVLVLQRGAAGGGEADGRQGVGQLYRHSANEPRSAFGWVSVVEQFSKMFTFSAVYSVRALVWVAECGPIWANWGV